MQFLGIWNMMQFGLACLLTPLHTPFYSNWCKIRFFRKLLKLKNYLSTHPIFFASPHRYYFIMNKQNNAVGPDRLRSSGSTGYAQVSEAFDDYEGRNSDPRSVSYFSLSNLNICDRVWFYVDPSFKILGDVASTGDEIFAIYKPSLVIRTPGKASCLPTLRERNRNGHIACSSTETASNICNKSMN